MTTRRRQLAALVYAAALASVPAAALVTGGGGGTATECLTVFDAPVNYRPERPRQVRCTDGDPACDEDGVVNGACTFSVAVCANSTFDPRCTYFGVAAVEVQHAADDGDPKFDPELQAIQSRIDDEIDPPQTAFDVCTAPTTVHVPIRGPLGPTCGRGRKLVKLVTTSTPPPGRPPRRDKDKLKLMCEPAPVGGCDPQVLFAGTFDRIERQVFAQHCAVSGCHDSQTFAGGMTLESGTAWASLVGVVPVNAAAAAAGWKRVDVTGPASGSVETSFLVHKLRGDLPDASFGERMPRGRPALDPLLVDLIALWIEAGAPETGWVAGTD